MLRKTFFTILSIFASANIAFSATVSGAPDVYRVTLYEMALCSDSSCSDPKIIGSNDSGRDFDIASASAGQNVGSFVDSLSNIDNGTYSHVRFVIGRSFVISGQLESGGTTYYTNNSGTDYTSAAAAAAAVTETQSKIYMGASTISGDKSEITTFVSDVSISASSLVSVNVTDSNKVDYIIPLSSTLVWDENAKYRQYALDFDISSTLGMSDSVAGTSSNWVSYIIAPTVSFSQL